MLMTRRKLSVSVFMLIMAVLCVIFPNQLSLTSYALSDTTLSINCETLNLDTKFNNKATVTGTIGGDTSSTYYAYAIDPNEIVTVQDGFTITG